MNDSLLSNKEIHTIDTPASSEVQEVVSEDPSNDSVEVPIVLVIEEQTSEI